VKLGNELVLVAVELEDGEMVPDAEDEAVDEVVLPVVAEVAELELLEEPAVEDAEAALGEAVAPTSWNCVP
jgi:hypothetical protein